MISDKYSKGEEDRVIDASEVHLAPQSSKSFSLIAFSVVVAIIVLTGLLLVLGRWLGWTVGWMYLGIVTATWGIHLACLQRWNPELLKNRKKINEGTKTWDKVWFSVFTFCVIVIYMVAIFETLYGVSHVPGVAWSLGLFIFLTGWVLVNQSMVINPFFEKTVRIQTDRGHQVIDKGPYAYVRHPGYVGFLSWVVATPLLLSSTWSLIPVLIAVIGLVIRTALEDRVLQSELPGYEEYSDRVRFRLIPGIW
ncbi:methyltransferase family protein [Leptothoe spongobia]|uniref:Isoprenylcysteine carboxylmethyltransferase family protein n=1 Tax=Leptothoe spongobia TAU-MAC 1115 TaxID=1967444 RepID=A0A947DBB3_9CYAN|nr:isoprenylcysteine carboxylmethyltransferase family protein [Leptothoe spongobia]MBT9314071.1 isoprenylcysteine carboxylmethyltransferase family protein [Leptothoe spongobia TAU-MAC 1115]